MVSEKCNYFLILQISLNTNLFIQGHLTSSYFCQSYDSKLLFSLSWLGSFILNPIIFGVHKMVKHTSQILQQLLQDSYEKFRYRNIPSSQKYILNLMFD